MEGEPTAPLELHRPIAHGDALPLGIDLHAQDGWLAIHSDPTILDQLFRCPA
jgi:hypothetical protein